MSATEQNDPVRASLSARIAERQLDMNKLSRAIGRNSSYLQQYLKRGVPLVLPEDVREKLAPLVGMTANDLRGVHSGKGGLRPTAPDAIATSEQEAEWLRLFRHIPESMRAKVIRSVIAFSDLD